MYLIISHFTENKWTTDYFIDYLESKNKKYYYLRHPFNFETSLNYSELIYFDGKNKNIISKYKKSNNFLFDIIRNIFLSFYIWTKLSFKIDKIVWFGWFNIFPFLYLKLFWKKTYFWWVDYSTKRFWSNFLNKIYFYLETISCLFTSKVISSSYRQNEARIKFHHLKKEKWIIINNWIIEIFFSKDFSVYKNLSFFYLWSITDQHWIIDFINYFYIHLWIKNKLYIIWWWEKEEELKNTITTNNLEKNIIYLWRKNQNETITFLESINEKLIWIAPYNDEKNDHVYYGDSLKIREYLNYNIPFLVSNKTYINPDLANFWLTYDTFESIKLENLKIFQLDLIKKNNILQKYYWNHLFSKIF